MDIALHRLFNQQIEKNRFSTPLDLIRWLGAIQAQDYAMAKWAMALRLPNGTDAVIEDALNQSNIIRTHIMRPTWHFVAASDIRWMLQLTAPHLKRIAASMNRQLELDEQVFSKIYQILFKSLEGGNHLSRQEIMATINQAGILTNGLRAGHIMFQAELDGVVCNGVKQNKQFTYALLDEKVPPCTKNFTRHEALAELAMRYFTSHGPATIQDFTWWSGLTLTDARLGLNQVKTNLISETIEDLTYWLADEATPETYNPASLHLLPAFDEFMISYKNRTASLLPAHFKETITGNGIFKPIIVVNGKVVGLWQTSPEKSKIKLHLSLFDSTVKLDKELLAAAVQKYAVFRNALIEIS
ncbi:winged helix DNA-binding domain-containing protein [Adhaeribacter radiodurans]|uniref:Winged helix DNA-binding domain-containing protein n=1 Tax=Adhaeribacter radiodurans TaxID=2745197 RepID=A0A7L7LD82_9BACT|nr:winged helix DNA-binding domain-containing protein [Adhaeribacter radiodurans]QMU30733.1 winged helix DNA-binding domain-containing protein [Adhaeribacter radiodurans]